MSMFVVIYVSSGKKHLCVCIEKFVLGQEDRQFIVYSNFAGYCAGIGTKPFEMLWYYLLVITSQRRKNSQFGPYYMIS